MISPPSGVSGIRAVPITVRSLNDGKALINGQGARQPLRLDGNDWFLIEGINVCCSSATVVSIVRSNHNVIRRVAAWDAHDGNDKIFGIHSSQDNLLEDVAGWGTARKTFEFSFGGDSTTVRRAWGRWERSTVAGPKMVYSLVYNNYDTLIENAIGTWSGEQMPETYVLKDFYGSPWTGPGAGVYTNHDVVDGYGVFSMDGLDGGPYARARLLGSLAYSVPTDPFKARALFFYTKTDGIEIRDTTAYYEPGTNGDKRTFELYQLSDGSDPRHDVASDISSFGGQGKMITRGWQTSNTLDASAPSLVYAAGESIYQSTRGANLCYRYEEGVLTDQPLWPWPMNDRIRDALLQSGHSAVDVTSTIRQMFGPIPSQCLASPPVSREPVTLPVAGRVAGWTTDLQVANPADRAAEAVLTFTPSGGLPPVRRTIFLRARQSVTLRDAIQTVFGYADASGSFRLVTGAEAAGPMELHARVYAVSSAGTLGAGVRSETPAASGVGLSRYVTGLSNTAAFRSTLGAANGANSAESFQIVLRDASGSILGTSGPIVLPPAQQIQWSLPSLFPNASGQPFSAEFRPVGGSAAPLGYAMVVDNRSGDPTYYSSSEPAPLAYLPAVSRISGAGGTLWLTDVTLTNPGDTPSRFTVAFLEHDRDNTVPPASRSVSLAPHQTIQVVDVLRQWFDLSETYGALRVSASSAEGPILSARMYTRSPGGSGTVGQQIAPTRPDELLTAGSLSGLRQDDEFRSILGFFNPGDSNAAVQLLLQNEDGELLASATLSLPPSSYAQRSLTGLFPAGSFSPGQFVSVAFDSGADGIAAFASTVDNASQDLTLSRATSGTARPGRSATPIASKTVPRSRRSHAGFSHIAGTDLRRSGATGVAAVARTDTTALTR